MEAALLYLVFYVAAAGGTFVAERADFSKLSKIRLVNGAVLAGRAKYRSALVFEVEAGCENLLRSYSSGTTIFVR